MLAEDLCGSFEDNGDCDDAVDGHELLNIKTAQTSKEDFRCHLLFNKVFSGNCERGNIIIAVKLIYFF